MSDDGGRFPEARRPVGAERASRWIALGAWSAGLAVVCGAFGAHGIEGRVGAEELDWWHTAVLYHLFHALGLVLFGLFARGARRAPGWVGWALVAGTAVFSGTLYAMTLGGPRWLGAVTPLGGAALIVAWIGFGAAAWRGAGAGAGSRTVGGDGPEAD